MAHFLGPKTIAYLMLVSIWGVLMLTVLGIFFKVRSPVLYDSINHSWDNGNFSQAEAQVEYDTSAINCWIAAALYAALFIFAFIMHKCNSRLGVGN